MGGLLAGVPPLEAEDQRGVGVGFEPFSEKQLVRARAVRVSQSSFHSLRGLSLFATGRAYDLAVGRAAVSG